MNELLSLHLAKEGNVEEIVDYYGAKLESGNADICMEYMAGEKKHTILFVLIENESSRSFPHFDKLVKVAIWRNPLSVQNEANSLVALQINAFWLVQKNHTAVQLKWSAVVIYASAI